VPINPRYFRHFNRDMMLTALAGPASNLLQAIAWAVVLKLVVMLGISERFVISVCAAGISVNLMLMAFNLIPIPPLDGGRILRGLLPSSGEILLDYLVAFMVLGTAEFFARPFLEAGRWLVELVL
jgi:Zn-dependent protease